MGWYKAVKGKLAQAATKRDARNKTSQPATAEQPTSPTSPTSPAPSAPAPWTGGGVISSTDAAHYEMKDNTIIVGLCPSWTPGLH
jgi:hypothetical protein